MDVEVAQGAQLRLRRFLDLLQIEQPRSLNAAARACEVLELLCRGQEELTSLLNRHNILPQVASCLLAATKAAPSSAWLPFATFLVRSISLAASSAGELDGGSNGRKGHRALHTSGSGTFHTSMGRLWPSD